MENLPPHKEIWMKRLAVIAVVLSVAACTAKDETPADTAAAPPAMAPAPAADTGMMKGDTGMMKGDTAMKKTP